MSIFIGIIIGMFGISIMQLVLATAMPFIVTEIGGDYLYGWVFSSYMLASLLTIPIFSKLADLYGKKRIYLLGMVIFAAGTLYGGLASSMEHLIAARVIQGLGAGMMTPVSIALISDLFPPEKRGSMIGAFSFVQLIANLIAPILGIVITKQLGWHFIFFIAFGSILIALVLIASVKYRSQSDSPIRWTEIDVLGGVVFGLFCVLLVSFSDVVSAQGRLDLTGILLLASAIVTGLILAWNESRHKDPIIKLAFFQIKLLRRSILSSLMAGAIMYGLVTLLPLCSVILERHGFKIDESRTLLLFMLGMTLGLLVSSRFVTRLSESFPRSLWGVSILEAAGMYYAVSVSNILVFSIATGFLGLCLGGIMATLLINSQNAVDSNDRTVLSGLVQLGRYLGASVGVTVLTGILPEVSQINDAAQFLSAFGLLVVMYVLGLVNELI